MQRRRFQWVLILFLGVPLIPGCGGSIYDPPKPLEPGEKKFIAKGKLKSDMEAKEKMKAALEAKRGRAR
jgi:hypothetical protein